MSAAGSVFPWLEGDVSETRALALDELTLDGKKLDANVSDALQDIPFERTIEGASTVQLVLIDPYGDVLDSGLFSAAVDVDLPTPNGRILSYRLVNVKHVPPLTTITFEDLEVARLRGHKRPRQASRSDVTRAEFIRMLVREAPGIRFWSPELHVKQPIGKRRDLPTKVTKKTRRDPGFGSFVPKVKGVDASRAQIRLLEAVTDTGLSMGGNDRVLEGGVICVTQESSAQNLAGGDRDSVGAFQQRRSMGWPASRDVAKDAHEFFKRLIPIERAHRDQTIGWCVDQVQRSYTFGTARQGHDYDQWLKEGRATVMAYQGRESKAGTFEETSYAKRYVYRRGEPGGKREDTWTCAGRLADEVQFRRFMDMGVFHYVSDEYLNKQAARQIITRGEFPEGVLQVRIPSWDTGQTSGEVEIDVLLDVLEPPLGAVWILHGYGPSSGRYLLTKIRGSYLQPKATVTLTSPQPILPEPASTTGTRSRAVAQSGDAMKVAGRQLVYPLAVHGTDLGGVAAHMARPFGNWQSDNAVDIGCPIGTEIFAVDDGIIVRLGGAYDGTGKSNPNGFNITLKTKDNQWFYTHLSERRGLKIGQRVDRGMSFGRSGAANGVAHLHIGSEKGDPEAILGVKNAAPQKPGYSPAPTTGQTQHSGRAND
jgi:hypothetical protein